MTMQRWDYPEGDLYSGGTRPPAKLPYPSATINLNGYQNRGKMNPFYFYSDIIDCVFKLELRLIASTPSPTLTPRGWIVSLIFFPPMC